MLRALYDLIVCAGAAGLASNRSSPLWVRAAWAIGALVCLISALGDAGLLGAGLAR
jgi:hypothetical protein